MFCCQSTLGLLSKPHAQQSVKRFLLLYIFTTWTLLHAFLLYIGPLTSALPNITQCMHSATSAGSINSLLWIGTMLFGLWFLSNDPIFWASNRSCQACFLVWVGRSIGCRSRKMTPAICHAYTSWKILSSSVITLKLFMLIANLLMTPSIFIW